MELGQNSLIRVAHDGEPVVLGAKARGLVAKRLVPSPVLAVEPSDCMPCITGKAVLSTQSDVLRRTRSVGVCTVECVQ